MYRRNSVNINDLINRFEVNDDDLGLSENSKYVKVTRPRGRIYKTMQDEDSDNLDDENRIIKYNEKKNYFNRSGKKRTNVTMSSAKEMTKHTVAVVLSRLSGFLEMISRFPFPRMSVMSFGITSLLAIFLSPRAFTERALFPGFRLIFSVIYPAYRSFKAVRNKNLKEYLKWIVFWIVFAFYTCLELVADAILSWFPFYYEIKVIFLIWMLGPSSRGAMRIYKTFIHPTLISHEQEIDGIIQTAEDRGYMHVFQMGSKSVNYANKIIMQETKSTDSYSVPHNQLMKNISLSNLSDIDTAQSNDVDEAFRTKKFSSEKIPLYGNQFNYLPFEQRRKSSFEFRCDEVSSGYSSPVTESIYRFHPMQSQHAAFIEEHEDDREMYYRNLSNTRAYSEMQAKDPLPSEKSLDDAPRRKTSINELSEDEIVFAYNKLKLEKNQDPIEGNARTRNEDLSSEMQAEFLRWMKMKRKDGKDATVTSNNEKYVEREKVKLLDETEVPHEVALNVVKTENEEIERDAEEIMEEKNNAEDFDEFKDVLSESEEEDDKKYLKVPLVILEENEEKQDNDVKPCQEGEKTSTVIESNSSTNDEDDEVEQNTVEAKITLSNAPLAVVTSLSSSSVSLASSDKSGDDVGGNKKQRAKHTKGRAPLPPNTNIPGHFYDQVTKKHFKETEL